MPSHQAAANVINAVEKYPPTIPEDLEQLVMADAGADKTGLGFQKYANTKLAIVTWSYALDRHLKRVSNCLRMLLV